MKQIKTFDCIDEANEFCANNNVISITPLKAYGNIFYVIIYEIPPYDLSKLK
jgi:hypothetical protein